MRYDTPILLTLAGGLALAFAGHTAYAGQELDGSRKADHYNATRSSLHTQAKRAKHTRQIIQMGELVACAERAANGSIVPCADYNKPTSNPKY